MIDRAINQLIAFLTGFSLLALLLMLVYQVVVFMNKPIRVDQVEERVAIYKPRGTLPTVPVSSLKDKNGNWLEFNENSKG